MTPMLPFANLMKQMPSGNFLYFTLCLSFFLNGRPSFSYLLTKEIDQ